MLNTDDRQEEVPVERKMHTVQPPNLPELKRRVTDLRERGEVLLKTIKEHLENP